MDWTQELIQSMASILTSIICMGSTIAIFLWARAESRSDSRALDAKIDAVHTKIDSNRIETQAMINAIYQEMKDFHGRLCAIEESKKSRRWRK